MTARFWLAALAALLILVGFLVAGRIVDHRPIPAGPPASVPVGAALFADVPNEEPAAALDSPWWDDERGVLVPMPLREEET